MNHGQDPEEPHAQGGQKPAYHTVCLNYPFSSGKCQPCINVGHAFGSVSLDY